MCAQQVIFSEKCTMHAEDEEKPLRESGEREIKCKQTERTHTNAIKNERALAEAT
jgi:hypothetical protein